MNNELIKIEAHEILIQSVNARDLYEFLGLADSQWSRWTKQNIENNEFAFENNDWVGFDMMSSGNKTRGYALSVDFAKRIAMMTKSEKGEQVRQYFLDCERRANQPLTTMQMIAHMALQIDAQNKRAEEQDRRLLLQEQRTNEIEARQAAIVDGFRYYSVLAYSKLNAINVDLATAQRIGRNAAILSRDEGVLIDKVRDPRFGEVNAYAETILDRVFGKEIA